MLKLLISATRVIPRAVVAPIVQNVPPKHVVRNFTAIIPQNIANPQPSTLLNNPQLINISNNLITRNLIKFSFRKGKRKSVRAVPERFYRLSWGAWIRTKCGRSKRLWKKSPPRKRRLRQHVICNATQSYLLDKMAGPYWTKRRYYVDDPYEPYHTREEFPLTATKPKPFDPPSGSVPYC